MGIAVSTQILPVSHEADISLYYQASAIYLDGIRAKSNTPHLVHLMLEEILRHNHRITKHRDADNRNLTLEINNCRNQLWWTNMKANNSNFKRNKMTDRPIQRGGGQVTPHHKILINMLGADWMKEAKRKAANGNLVGDDDDDAAMAKSNEDCKSAHDDKVRPYKHGPRF